MGKGGCNLYIPDPARGVREIGGPVRAERRVELLRAEQLRRERVLTDGRFHTRLIGHNLLSAGDLAAAFYSAA